MKKVQVSTNLLLSLFLVALVQPTRSAFGDGVIVHLFEWRWEDIAWECENYLSSAGIKAVQVSPAQDHVFLWQDGYPWYQRYQPVSYYINSRSGNLNDFTNMVQRCKAVGVDIYVDVVMNHMCQACTQSSNLNYPDVPYSPLDFHPNCEITSYQNSGMVQNCKLNGLPDLDTSKAYVQDKIASYMNTLISLGVEGFRLDASKHIQTADMTAILGKVGKTTLSGRSTYFVLEVIDYGGEPITGNQYFQFGDVTDFKYGYQIAEKFGPIGSFKPSDAQLINNIAFPIEESMVFVDNHDNQRIGNLGFDGVLTHARRARYSQATAFMLSYPTGRPNMISSYYWQRNITVVNGKNKDVNGIRGPPSLGFGVTKRANCNWTLTQDWNNWNDDPNMVSNWPEWICEHRWPVMKSMVGFYNYIVSTTSSKTVHNFWSSPSGWAIAYGRGNKGFVVINSDTFNSVSATLSTGLPRGTYCDIITGSLSADKKSCTGKSVTIDSNGNGFFQVGVSSSLSVFAIHTGQLVQDIRRTVVFIEKLTSVGQDMFIRGGLDHAQFGCSSTTCSSTVTNLNNCLCSIPITHRNLLNVGTTLGWKTGDTFLDWYGKQNGQGGNNPQGTPFEWTTNLQGGATYAANGFGYTPLNTWGPHNWMLDVDMDCSRTSNGWFEVKAFVTGVGWESDITQAGTPYSSKNHFAQCGRISRFVFGSNTATFLDF